MALEHIAFGCATIYFNAYEIGISRNGVEISIDPKWNDIPSDCGGGEGGVPSDAQLLGAIVRVSCELTKFDKNKVFNAATYSRIRTDLVNGLGDVNMPTIGQFVRQGNNALGGILDLRGQNARLIFPVGFLRQPQDFNFGTRASFYTLGWECWLEDYTTRKLMQFATAI